MKGNWQKLQSISGDEGLLTTQDETERVRSHTVASECILRWRTMLCRRSGDGLPHRGLRRPIDSWFHEVARL